MLVTLAGTAALTGTDGNELGEVSALFEAAGCEGARVALGGGGRGAILLLSAAAAAAAAEAYLSISPGALAGGGAGFIELGVAAFVVYVRGACNVAKDGRGDLRLFEGLRAPRPVWSADFDFASGSLGSGGSIFSSCTD